MTCQTPNTTRHKTILRSSFSSLACLLACSEGHSTKSHAVTQRGHCISVCPLCFDHFIHYSSRKVCKDPAQLGNLHDCTSYITLSVFLSQGFPLSLSFSANSPPFTCGSLSEHLCAVFNKPSFIYLFSRC